MIPDPVMHRPGYPPDEAKPTGLFVNTISLVGAIHNNVRNRRVDFTVGIPMIFSSMILAPLGAYMSISQ